MFPILVIIALAIKFLDGLNVLINLIIINALLIIILSLLISYYVELWPNVYCVIFICGCSLG